MTKKSVLDLIRQGEGKTIEFKERLPQPKDLARELCAFANTNDGYIIIGVNDNGELKGYIWEKRDDEYIVNVGSNNCNPHIIPLVYKVKIDNKEVAVLEVLRGESRPYKANNIVYVREGSVSRPADREKEVRLLQNGGYLQFDALSVKGALIEDLAREKIDRYLTKRAPAIAKSSVGKKREVLCNLYYLSRKNGKIVPTNAGLLSFSDFPQKFIAQARIKCFYINGIKRTDYIVDHKLIEGDIVTQINRTVDFLKFSTKVARITKGERKDKPQYDQDALKEAVANAVAHRDYFITGREILIFVYDNRVEIESPGGLAGDLRIADLGKKRYARNPVLAQFLYEMGEVEGAGRGIARIIELQFALGAKRPRFSADRDTFTITLYPSFVV